MIKAWLQILGSRRGLKYLGLLLLVLLGVLYSAPNFYGDDPSVQITTAHGSPLPPTLMPQIKDVLAQSHLHAKAVESESPTQILIRFSDSDSQLHATDKIKAALGDDYVVALHLAPSAPAWFAALGAHSMKLGLDLRGGVHLTINVDTQDVVMRSLEADRMSMMQVLRENNIHYENLASRSDQRIAVQLRSADDVDHAFSVLKKQYVNYQWAQDREHQEVVATLTVPAQQVLVSQVVEQTMTTLRNRVNELGVSEAIVQMQGANRVSVDLPGIQDSARAKEILGGTATVEFHMMDDEHAANLAGGTVPFGTQRYMHLGHPILLKKQVILYGKSITDARANFDESGRPAVSIQLGGGDVLFYKETRHNIGKYLATVFVETKTQTKMVNGEEIKLRSKQERVINVAVIKDALGRNFQVSGLDSEQESTNLALLLRAGALPANIEIVEERVVGPKLGAENIERGMMSLAVGMAAIIIFMTFYYRVFGLLANIALTLNLIFLTALLSLLGATLTFPGIAGIVLTVGMAVDANVLIFERIREELRLGMSPMGSIKAGFERALATIIDANLTTFIVAFLLFSIGTGAIKGFAVTLSLGLLTSMLTAITYTRALVDLSFARPGVKRLPIGI
jgi:preprotein translocase subunit SecD